ncbi:MAG: CoA transferase, partial [Ignavibacteria bacterium]|nr:CoA transferase [Ignavibacteria bacterium]
GEILSLEDALNQPQIKHRNAVASVHASEVGEIKVFNYTSKFDKTNADVDSPPPLLSQHTVEILNELGYGSDEIEELKAKKII